MTDSISITGEEFIKDMPEQLKDAPISPEVGMAAIALNFALKYHDINTVQDGALYQQYKLEGRNMHGLHLDMVFETAMQIERHLLQTPSRLAVAVLEIACGDINAVLDEEDASGIETEGQDREDGLGAQPESPTVEDGDAQ